MDDDQNKNLEESATPEPVAPKRVAPKKELEEIADSERPRRFRLPGSILAAMSVAAISALWLGSGFIQRAGLSLLETEPKETMRTAKALPAVRTRVVLAEEMRPEITIRGGRVEAERAVTIRAEINGKIMAVADKEGDLVEKGEVLCSIAIDARAAEKKQAAAMLKLRRLQLQAAKKLAQQGHNTRMSLAQSQANFDGAKTMFRHAELSLDNTKVVAPFDGILEKVFVDEGDVMTPGTACAKVIDMSPLVLSGQVTGDEAAKIERGVQSWALMPDGSRLKGFIRYISPSADPKTSTYRIEMEAEEPSKIARDGLTVQITVPLLQVRAHRIDSSILTLNDKGQLGIRLATIKDGKSFVQFSQIEVVASDQSYIWVSGLPEIARIITVGQEYVKQGTEIAISEEPPANSLVTPNENDPEEEKDL